MKRITHLKFGYNAGDKNNVFKYIYKVYSSTYYQDRDSWSDEYSETSTK